MWRYFAFFFCFSSVLADYSPNYFCADLSPQPTVIIPQLMGMWFGIEKIDHLSERHYIRTVPSCPIVHLSEDHPVTTMNPLYRNTQYYGYGGAQNYPTGVPQYPKTQEEDQQQQQMEYDRRTTYRNHPARKLHRDYQNYNAEEHYLRMFWDENGESTEYHLRYNVSRKGFWISSGPENGAALKTQFSHFAGTIQVLKAVGNHMILTICHQLPERQVYSIILSRETKLNPVEVHSIHRMLIRRGLNTNYVEKLCSNSGSRLDVSKSMSVLLIVGFIYRILK